eukprot:GEMP01017281.1.p1 GENE.GEMP01017281.1~~GEMP01017281.1.p1  ORF type:complete len:640 (+),score=102.29 GEMP01017281.1:291-2210(+)
MGATSSAPIPERPEAQRFTARIPRIALREGACYFCLAIQSPVGPCRRSNSSPSEEWTVERRYKEFYALHNSLELKYGSNLPHLPPATIFSCLEPDFLDARRKALEVYINRLFRIVSPHLQIFQRFLDVPYSVILGGIPTARMMGEHTKLCVPNVPPISSHLVSYVLSWLPPVEVHRDLALVCSAFRGAGFHPMCWPSIRFHSEEAERRLDGLFCIFQRSAHILQKIDLKLEVVDQDLAPLCPCIAFTKVRRFSLTLNNAAAVVGASILDCVDVAHLELFAVEATFNRELYHACTRIIANTKIDTLKINLVPVHHLEEIVLDAAFLKAVENHGRGKEISIGIPFRLKACGIKRKVEEVAVGWQGEPFTQSFLPQLSLLHERLRVLTFDFLCDDILRPIATFEDRKFLPNILSITFSGTTQRITMDTHDVVALLLTKLGSKLQVFSYLPETAYETRGFDQGRLPPEVGPLPRIWTNRQDLRVLEIDQLALNEQGVECIVIRCPHLRVLRLSRMEYWTDQVAQVIVQGLPELERLRIGGQGDLLSDRMLYTLAESKLKCIELMPSYSHSTFGIEHLRAALTGDVVGGVSALINYAAGIGGAGNEDTTWPIGGRPPELKARLYILPKDDPATPKKPVKFYLGW